MATDYNSIMDDDNDIEDDYDLDDDDLDDDGADRELMSNGRKKIVAAAAGLVIIVVVAFALSFFAGDNSKPEAPTPRASSQASSAPAATQGSSSSGLGLSGSNGNSIELTNTIKAFGQAVYSGDGQSVYNMTSQRCRSSVEDAQAFADSYVAQAGKGFKVKDLTYENDAPKLGVSFVTYKVKNNESASLNVYFLWDRGAGAWVMDSCNL